MYKNNSERKNIFMKTKKLNGKSNIVGKNVKKYRELRGYSQRELSDKIALLRSRPIPF